MGQERLTHTNYYSQWPDFMKRAADASQLGGQDWQPVIVDMSNSRAVQDLRQLAKDRNIVEIIDNYDEQLAELLVSRNAQLYKANKEVKAASIQDYLKEHYGGKPSWEKGSWVYYPWSGKLVHILEEKLFWDLRTIRNQVLISSGEQEAYAGFRVGCVGMSVGSNGAAAIAMTGGSRQIKLADGAVLSGSNLNRVRQGVDGVGLNKCIVQARELYEMNPYLAVDIYPKNLTASTLNNFFEKPWPLDAVIDEIDDLEMKVRMRLEAKKRKLPLVMVTEPGDTVMLDVERFDLHPDAPIFHGLAPGIEELLDKGELNQREKVKYMIRIIGLKNLPLRDQQAMLKVGSELPSPPQLGSTAMIAGGIIAFAVRSIATGKKLEGRNKISLEQAFISDAKSLKNRYAHHKHSAIMRQAIKSM